MTDQANSGRQGDKHLGNEVLVTVPHEHRS